MNINNPGSPSRYTPMKNPLGSPNRFGLLERSNSSSSSGSDSDQDVKQSTGSQDTRSPNRFSRINLASPQSPNWRDRGYSRRSPTPAEEITRKIIGVFDQKIPLNEVVDTLNEIRADVRIRSCNYSDRILKFLYNKCLGVKSLELSEACFNLRKEMKQTEESDVILYSAMIDKLFKRSRTDKAEALIREMNLLKITPNNITHTICIDGYMKNGMFEDAIRFILKEKNNITYTEPVIGVVLGNFISKLNRLLDKRRTSEVVELCRKFFELEINPSTCSLKNPYTGYFKTILFAYSNALTSLNRADEAEAIVNTYYPKAPQKPEITEIPSIPDQIFPPLDPLLKELDEAMQAMVDLMDIEGMHALLLDRSILTPYLDAMDLEPPQLNMDHVLPGLICALVEHKVRFNFLPEFTLRLALRGGIGSDMKKINQVKDLISQFLLRDGYGIELIGNADLSVLKFHIKR